jgi:glycosyltransferase involved in cell wall biosynthesis
VILGIDASNLRRGGGVTHLTEVLGAADPCEHGFSRVIVWAGSATLARIEPREWLEKAYDPLLDGPLQKRVFWQRFRLSRAARAGEYDVLFVPGGSDASGFRRVVTMSRNLLPFESREVRRYGFSRTALKFRVLRLQQTASLRRAAGVIFLTEYARAATLKVTGSLRGRTAIIPHGVSRRFMIAPRSARSEAFTDSDPCRVIYVSNVDFYKHQPRAAEAVARLRALGIPIRLDMVGPAHPPALRRLEKTLVQLDPQGLFLRYHGYKDYADLHEFYRQADISLFASSCETFGQILVEAMAAGLPIACSNRSAMPELLGDAGVYFDPEDMESVAAALGTLVDSAALRGRLARAAHERAAQFTWERCADQTFSFMAHIGSGSNSNPGPAPADYSP